jgi:UDP-N-acetylmuramoyl-tripeptide--D-alanyl-D-alanine ligase
VPVTLLGITNETQLAIVEMGANHQGEIADLCSFAEPNYGLVTNIGKAHLGGFGGYEGVVKAKSELYTWLRNSGGKVFVNAGNPLLMEITAGMDRILYGSEGLVFAKGLARKDTERLCIDLETQNGKTAIETNLVGNYNFENVMAAVCLGLYFNVPDSEIITAINTYIPSNNRSQALKTRNNSLILDAYNANPSSMKAAIENFRQVKALDKMVILGDMLELGDVSITEHSAIVKLVEESGFKGVVFVGPDFMKVASGRFVCFSTSDEAHDWLAGHKPKGFTILVKGSRGIKMERVLDAL